MPPPIDRRAMLCGCGVAAALTALPRRAAALTGLTDDTILNPCLPVELPSHLARHEIVTAAWEGIDPSQVWDCHVHLAGTGDSGDGPWLNPAMAKLWHPVEYIRRIVMLNAACVDRDAVDVSFVRRLHDLCEGLPAGCKALLLAFDRYHDEGGIPHDQHSAFHIPDRYAASVVRAHPARFGWIASVHPYREDAVEALERAVRDGALAVKWLPVSMGMDPASARCDALYRALARLDVPLLTHGGDEAAVHGKREDHLANPLRLRRALDHGVRVIIAHCASLGRGVDLDRGPDGPKVPNFDLFARLMAEPRYARLLYGDISAVVQRNRIAECFPALLERSDWHDRLLFGSDYPLPGVIPLISVGRLADRGLLDPRETPVLIEVRRHNPLLFDFLLKRRLAWQGKRFATQVFETRRVFERRAPAALTSPAGPASIAPG
jgi:mannonate dehydratase